jgi:hypothetical protein
MRLLEVRLEPDNGPAVINLDRIIYFVPHKTEDTTWLCMGRRCVVVLMPYEEFKNLVGLKGHDGPCEDSLDYRNQVADKSNSDKVYFRNNNSFIKARDKVT